MTPVHSDVADLPALSTKKQVAAWRQVSTRKVELDCNAGIFPAAVRCGTHPRWRRSDLLNWLNAQPSRCAAAAGKAIDMSNTQTNGTSVTSTAKFGDQRFLPVTDNQPGGELDR